MTLNEIYDWIVANIPLFKGDQETNSSVGWKNSIRHNLSLHSIFVKEQQVREKKIRSHNQDKNFYCLSKKYSSFAKE